jgi:hypothetical protein
MPVVSMMRFPGDPDELVAKITETIDPVSERLAEKHGGLINIVARDGDNGILVVNIWETEEGRHAMAAEPEIQEALQKAGMPPPNFEGFPIERLRISDRALTAATS